MGLDRSKAPLDIAVTDTAAAETESGASSTSTPSYGPSIECADRA
jgi:hypothetical protein